MQDMICLKDHPLVGEFIKCMMLALVIRMIVAQLMRIPKNHQATELFHKHIFLVGMLLWLKVIKKKQTTDEHSLTTKSDHHVFFAKGRGHQRYLFLIINNHMQIHFDNICIHLSFLNINIYIYL